MLLVVLIMTFAHFVSAGMVLAVTGGVMLDRIYGLHLSLY